MSGSGAEDGNANLVDIVGADCSRSPRDKLWALNIRDGGGGIRGRERVGYGRTEEGIMKRLEEPDKISQVFDREVIIVARNPIWTAPNAPIASAPGK